MQLSKMKDTLTGTLTVALILCVACSLVVSAAAVMLKPGQEANAALDQQKNILDAAGLALGEYGRTASELSDAQIENLYSRVSEKMINLDDGTVNTDVDPKEFDLIAASQSAEYSKTFTELRAADPEYAGPKFDFGEERKLEVTKVFFVTDANGEQLTQVVLPIYGKGLWGTLYGYMALKSDLKTIEGITFYQHKETPGLGGEVDNPAWKKQWAGKHLYDETGEPAAYVFKGAAPDDNVYAVDGLSGATITSRGVTNLVQYWASEDGYKPFLATLKQKLESGDLEMIKRAPNTTETDNG